MTDEKSDLTPPRGGGHSESVSKYVLLYVAAACILLVVAIITLVPLFVPTASFVFRDATLSILYAVISLAIAMLLFGVIGDSGALVRLSGAGGSLVQITGSAAGFAVFYYLLSSGLSPYSFINFYVYDDRGQLVRADSGEFEITVLSQLRQSLETDNGFATFPIPRSESDVRVDIISTEGRTWVLDKVEPAECVASSGVLSLSCDEFSLHLRKENRCISDLIMSSYEDKEITTNLEIVIDTLKENLQNATPDISVNVQYSPGLIESTLLSEAFQLERKNEAARPICEHLAAIENRFNISVGEETIKTYLSCTKIIIALPTENVEEGAQQCL